MTVGILDSQNYENLAEKLEKFQIIKNLLTLDEKSINFSEKEIQDILNKITYDNFPCLTIIKDFFDKIPQSMKTDMVYLSNTNSNSQKYFSEFEVFKNKFLIDVKYQEYEIYFLTKLAGEATKYIPKNIPLILSLTENIFIINRIRYSIIMYNLLIDYCNDIVKFNTENLIYNLPLLLDWICKNKYKPIGNLSNDECEIIAGLFYGYDYEKMLTLELHNYAKSEAFISQALIELPTKLNVKNLTQALFRFILLKPDLLKVKRHKKLVSIIKSFSNKQPNNFFKTRDGLMYSV